MSLKPSGMPSSWPFSPFARRWSAFFAWARLRSSSTVMKAFSSPLRRAMRARNWRVSSTEETFFASSAPASSSRVELSKLLDHFRHEVQVAFHCRCDALISVVLIALRDFVLTQPLAELLGVRHRLDAGDVDRAHFVDE